MAKKKRAKQWGWSPASSASGPALDAAARAEVEAKVKELIAKELKPRHVKSPPEDARFNYITDITLRWHGSTLFLVAVYACPGPNALSPRLEERFARLSPPSGGLVDLDFMRHAG